MTIAEEDHRGRMTLMLRRKWMVLFEMEIISRHWTRRGALKKAREEFRSFPEDHVWRAA